VRLEQAWEQVPRGRVPRGRVQPRQLGRLFLPLQSQAQLRQQVQALNFVNLYNVARKHRIAEVAFFLVGLPQPSPATRQAANRFNQYLLATALAVGANPPSQSLKRGSGLASLALGGATGLTALIKASGIFDLVVGTCNQFIPESEKWLDWLVVIASAKIKKGE